MFLRELVSAGMLMISHRSADLSVVIFPATFQVLESSTPEVTRNSRAAVRKSESAGPAVKCFVMGLEAWYMDGSEEDQRRPHRLEPHQPVSLEQLKELGVFYWQVSPQKAAHVCRFSG